MDSEVLILCIGMNDSVREMDGGDRARKAAPAGARGQRVQGLGE